MSGRIEVEIVIDGEVMVTADLPGPEICGLTEATGEFDTDLGAWLMNLANTAVEEHELRHS